MTRQARVFVAGILVLAGLTLACDGPPTAPTPTPTSVSIASVTPAGGAIGSATPIRILGEGFRPGARVTIGGEGFRPGAGVTIGGAASNVVVVDSTTITAHTPAHAAATVDLVVTNPDGTSGRLPSGFRYAALELTGIEPEAGQGGEVVRIRGAGFAPGAVVSFGGIQAVVMSSDNYSFIDALAPERSGGTADVVVTNPNGNRVTRFGGFRYTIGTISLSAQTVTAGAAVTVSWVIPPQSTGRGFEEAIVLMHTATGRFLWYSDTSGTDSGTRTVIAPKEPGQYEFQYRANDDLTPPYYRILGRSPALTVTAGLLGSGGRP